jgi:hypothetical protein
MHEYDGEAQGRALDGVMEYLLDIGVFGTAGIATFKNNSKTRPRGARRSTTPGASRTCASRRPRRASSTRSTTCAAHGQADHLEYSKPGDYLPAKVKESLQRGQGRPRRSTCSSSSSPSRRTTSGNFKRGKAGMAFRTVHIAKDMRRACAWAATKRCPSPSAGSSRAARRGPRPLLRHVRAARRAVRERAHRGRARRDREAARPASGGARQRAPRRRHRRHLGRRHQRLRHRAGASNEKPIFSPSSPSASSSTRSRRSRRCAARCSRRFFLDRLLDLNNQTQMTAYETSVRDKKNGQALGGVFSRQQKEVHDADHPADLQRHVPRRLPRHRQGRPRRRLRAMWD